MMKDTYIGTKVYRIVTWEDHPRQPFPYCIIRSNHDGGDWLFVTGFDDYDEAVDYVRKLKDQNAREFRRKRRELNGKKTDKNYR